MKIKTKYKDVDGKDIYVGDIISFEQIGSNVKIISEVIDQETTKRFKKIAGARLTDDLNYIEHRLFLIS